ncbi:MAG TPA: SpoIIE family protein phosphatase [Vicinamibacterales bacterium]|nr:SpoIIE family protein phosphatase [Vicinamibacterales bacterium]
MLGPRLEINDGLGSRVVPIDKPVIAIGRRNENDLRLTGSDVSRDHAEISAADGTYILRDRGSRYGTFVNGEQVSEQPLRHGDRIQFGRASGTNVVFLVEDLAPPPLSDRSQATAVGDIRQLASLLEGLRALGSGRVLDEVLALVLDAAIEVTGAERGFIMLSNEGAAIEMKLARARGKITLPGNRFDTSRKIPEEVFATGELKIVADLLDGDLANAHMGTVALGIRHVLCAPLRLVRYLDRADLPSEPKTIGVLYLDSRERGSLLSGNARAALDTLATEAGVAIENARLYRQSLEQARIEHELRIAAEIQRALLPPGHHTGVFYEAIGTSLPSRSIGGDFFDFTQRPDGSFGFAVGDVSGKGPAAALLTAKIQGLLGAGADTGTPAEIMQTVNRGLTRRAIEARYATIFSAMLTPGGLLTFCNAGHNPPLLFGGGRMRRLESGSMPVGMFDFAQYADATEQMTTDDVLVVYSDGVTEALNVDGQEFGEERLAALVEQRHADDAVAILDAIVAAVEFFARGAAQHDDVTAMVVKFTG